MAVPWCADVKIPSGFFCRDAAKIAQTHTYTAYENEHLTLDSLQPGSLRQAPGTRDPHIIDDPTIPTPVPPPETKLRPTSAEDAADLAAAMAARGGTPADHAPAARRLLDRAPVLLLAERAGSNSPRVVGRSGATLTALHPGAQPRWLTAGLTVTPRPDAPASSGACCTR